MSKASGIPAFDSRANYAGAMIVSGPGPESAGRSIEARGQFFFGGFLVHDHIAHQAGAENRCASRPLASTRADGVQFTGSVDEAYKRVGRGWRHGSAPDGSGGAIHRGGIMRFSINSIKSWPRFLFRS